MQQAAHISEKTIGAFEARRTFGKLLQEVVTNDKKFVVERNGEPAAALVPIQIYNQWKERRKEFFDWMREASERSQRYHKLSEEEAAALADEAVAAVRKQYSYK